MLIDSHFLVSFSLSIVNRKDEKGRTCYISVAYK
uniref:Phospholipidsterol O-acyltransferase isoform X3 n=1 Tax=Rhizophora mucronata TaxID=61149 RepID=A0A2P2L2Y2_RHIMU